MKFLKYLILPFIFFLFIPIVSADTIENIGYLNSDTSVVISDNYGNDISLPRQTINSQNINIRTIIITASYQFNANTDYILELSTPNAKLDTNINSISLRGNGQICNFKSLTDMSIGYPKIRFSCPSDTSYIVLSMSNLSYDGITTSYNFAWNYSYLSRVFITDGSQDIINNQNQNTQDIIDNQNQNTQDIINSNKVCQNYNFNKQNNIELENKSLNNDGTTSDNTYTNVSSYIPINKNENYTMIFNPVSTVNYCLYNNNKSLLSCSSASSTGTTTITPTQDGYIRYTLPNSRNNRTFTFTGKYCQNGNQVVNDSINNLNDTLNDDSTDGVDLNSLGNVSGWLPAGPIDSILLLPINFLSAFNSALSGTCSPLHINVPFIHTDVDIPCISTIFGQINGLTTFWNWVGRIVSIYILIKYFIGLYDYYDKLTTLQVNFIDDFGGGV